jgi:hypothetical protein
MVVEDLPRWARDPSIKRDKSGHRLYRTTAACGHEAWLTKARAQAQFCSRSCAILHLTDENSSRWIGDDAGYEAQHQRLRRIMGKASACSNRDLGLRACTSTNYTWSLLHNDDPLDPLSYVSLCKSCHTRYDYHGGNAGIRNHFAKLDDAAVLACRSRSRAGETTAELARAYGVSWHTATTLSGA